MGVQPVRPVPRFSRRQPDLSVHAVGQSDPQCLRLAAAVLSARRGLRRDLQGADGGDGLGRLRRRQLREMRQLHGPQRLRGDSGASTRSSGPGRRSRVALGGVATEGPMAPEIALDRQRPAEFVFERGVAQKLSEMRRGSSENRRPSRPQRRRARNAAALSTAAAIRPGTRRASGRAPDRPRRRSRRRRRRPRRGRAAAGRGRPGR